jgi:site-specific DNA recombinase
MHTFGRLRKVIDLQRDRISAPHGRQPCGQPPLGYRAEGVKKDRRFVIVEGEAAIVRRIFELYVGGVGINRICRTLNEEGLRTRRGATFCARVVLDTLAKRTYLARSA